MANISRVTRRDIIDLFKNGITIYNPLIMDYEISVFYPYYGCIEIVGFLNRLYDLEKWESQDPRLSNAAEEIKMHTLNGDYPYEWIFDDERFQLFNGEDAVFLNFLCEVFHPEVRDDGEDWRGYLQRINELLQEDGYELFVARKISGRDVYAWRPYTKRSDVYIPFSLRNKENKKSWKLPNELRYQLFSAMDTYNEEFYVRDETGCECIKSVTDCVLEEVYKFYKPQHYVGDCLLEVKRFDDFQLGTNPKVVFDVIEIFDRNISKSEEFEKIINTYFELHGIDVGLVNKEIHLVEDDFLLSDQTIQIDEIETEKLLRDSRELYAQQKYSLAVEKLWDAYERIKTYYSPVLDKKSSTNKIIDDLGEGNQNIRKVFNDEFKALNTLGNDYNIRHHEKNKIIIKGELHYKYLYKRCYALISTIIEMLKK